MATTLRTYQHKLNNDCAVAVKEHVRTLVFSPTGSGKTECFLDISRRAIAKQNTVLIITESRKIHRQIHQREDAFDISAGVRHMYIDENEIYIAMAQTLVKRPKILEQFKALGNKLVIINDEAHIATANKVLTYLSEARLLGFTATPKGDHLQEIYRHCVMGPQVSDLIQEGYLSPYKHFARVAADLDKLKIKNGEFTEDSQMAAFASSGVYDGLLEDLRCFTFKKGMIFCSSIQHCDDVYEMLEFNNIPCVKIHSKNENNDFDLMTFETDPECKLCVTVAMLNKGYDFPTVDLECLLFATTSISRYLQSIGRGSRIEAGKTHHVCLDYGENWLRHGLWDMDREWDKIWCEKRKKKSERDGVKPVKMCPECFAIISSGILVCNFCGALLPKAEQEVKNGELVEITEKYSKLIGRKLSSLTPSELAIYARLKNKSMFAMRIARAHEQEFPGWLDAYANCMRYKPAWVHIQLRNMPAEKIEYQDFDLK